VYLQAGVGIDTVIIVGGGRKLIDKRRGNIYFVEPKKMKRMPDARNPLSVIEVISSEFYVSDNKKEVHFRGSRNDKTAYYIDGIRTENAEGIPGLGIGNMTIYSGGVPARYGDFTGGCIVIESMGYFDWLAMQTARDRLYEETTTP
jgi:hypothetical protein